MSTIPLEKLTFYYPAPLEPDPVPLPPPPPAREALLPAHRGKSCGVNVHYRNRHNHSMHKVFSILCGRWNCSVCGPIRKKRWEQHLAYKVMEYDGEIYLKVVSKEQWPAYSQIIHRNKKQYAKIERADGYLIVITNCAISSGQALSSQEAQHQVEIAVRLATFEHRAISTCRAWAIAPKEKKETTWEKVQTLHSSMEDVQKTLKHLQMSRCITRNQQDCIIFMMPWKDPEAEENVCLWLDYRWPDET